MLEKELSQEEEIGCTVDYRCSSCATCKTCKSADRLRTISLKEEAEELLIANSVFVDMELKETTCIYPFIVSPEEFLQKVWFGKSSNFKMAESIFNTQRRKSDEVRESVTRFHKELQDKGFVKRLVDLPDKIQDSIKLAGFKHYFCWRSLFKEGSQSTPTRMVVDPAVSSFNETLAKGNNCLTSLYMNVINWRAGAYAFTTDISKMFNTLKLRPDIYKYVLYLFSKNLKTR